MPELTPLIAANDLSVSYPAQPGRSRIHALKHLNLSVHAGEFVAIIGQSGAGKTTLLRCLTGFVQPTEGALRVNGVDMNQAGPKQLTQLRRDVATVYQQFYLTERASALTNVLCGRLGYLSTWRSLLGWFPQCDRQLAYTTLEKLGLGESALQRVDQLSGGERQRVAVARALVQRPHAVLADEPAASLDISLARFVLDTLQRIHQAQGTTILINLHDLELARRYAQRVIALRHGTLVFDGPPEKLTAAIEEEVFHDHAPQRRAGND